MKFSVHNLYKVIWLNHKDFLSLLGNILNTIYKLEYLNGQEKDSGPSVGGLAQD